MCKLCNAQHSPHATESAGSLIMMIIINARLTVPAQNMTKEKQQHSPAQSTLSLNEVSGARGI
jgi:hypothetical protein